MAIFQVTEVPRLQEQIDELRARGLDPGTATCCAPSMGHKPTETRPGSIPGVAGCQQYFRCPFHKKENGGFKGHLPHNVPYFIDAKEGLPATEMFLPCFLFVRNMMPRMVAGRQSIDEGLNGEVIEILAEDGKLATEVMMTGFVLTSEPGKLPEKYERKDTLTPVPPYKYPKEMESKTTNTLNQRREERLARQAAREQGEVDAPLPTRKSKKAKDGEPWELNDTPPQT